MQFTRTLWRATSRASVRANMTVAAFMAPMIDSPGVAILAASDAITTTDPLRRATIDGTTIRAQFSSAVKWPSICGA